MFWEWAILDGLLAEVDLRSSQVVFACSHGASRRSRIRFCRGNVDGRGTFFRLDVNRTPPPIQDEATGALDPALFVPILVQRSILRSFSYSAKSLVWL